MVVSLKICLDYSCRVLFSMMKLYMNEVHSQELLVAFVSKSHTHHQTCSLISHWVLTGPARGFFLYGTLDNRNLPRQQ